VCAGGLHRTGTADYLPLNICENTVYFIIHVSVVTFGGFGFLRINMLHRTTLMIFLRVWKLIDKNDGDLMSLTTKKKKDNDELGASNISH
jgi:hypothetical protein